MRKSYGRLVYLIKKQLEMLIKLTVNYFKSVLQYFFLLTAKLFLHKDFIYSVAYSMAERINTSLSFKRYDVF